MTQKLQGYNKLIAQPKTNANLVRTCYNYGLLNTVYTYDGEEVSLSVAKIFEIPTMRNWFKRQKEEYYVVSQREHIIDCKYTKGKAKIPIINKRIINKEIQDIKAKNPIKYVHLGGTEILIKACFREGIDTPIEIYLADDRIIQPIEKSIIKQQAK